MRAIDEELRNVAKDTIRMLSLVRQSLDFARAALVDARPEAADACQENDREVDSLQEHLERRILTVIARHQPTAGNLRFLGASFRSLVDIERAGDYAVHVANAGAKLAAEPPLKRYLDMQRMLEVEDSMIERILAALSEADAATALRAREMDEEVDQLYDQIQRELLTYMIEDPRTIAPATELLAVARHLERLGDHLENVCEHIVFWLTGERQ